MKRKACEHQKADAFSSRYPNISSWVRDGWIEIGRDDYSRSMVRIMDEGGMVWEVKSKYESLDDLLQHAEAAIAHWMENN